MKNKHYITASVFAALCVTLGAMGAHLLAQKLSPQNLQVFETAVRYHFYHCIALFLALLLHERYNNKYFLKAYAFFLIGIVLFSGSLYLLSTRSLWNAENIRFIGMITPFGGLSFITGWLLIAFAFYKKPNNE